MNTYIKNIEKLIKEQIKNAESKTILIRLEGFETPQIYEKVCSSLLKENNINLTAKLTKEKFNQFKEQNVEEWKKSLQILENNKMVDFDETATRLRNESVNFVNENNKINVILLMGTEAVKDHGSLEEFYYISSQSIMADLKKDYSIWFKELLEKNHLSDAAERKKSDTEKAIDTYFQVLFRHVNVNLLKLSNLIDELSETNFFTGQEIIEEISLLLNKYWNLMNIEDKNKVPNLKKLKGGKVSSAEILEKNYKFITRAAFNKSMSEKELKKYRNKASEYSRKENIDVNARFPVLGPVFSNFNEFTEELIEFIQGKNFESLQEKFFKIDYGIIDNIIKIKVDKEKDTKTSAKERQITVKGKPLTAYLKMISEIICDCYKENNSIPEEIFIEVQEVYFSNCLKDTAEEEENIRKLIYRFGGILNYISDNLNKDSLNIKINYAEAKDSFTKAYFDKNKVTSICRNGLNHIIFSLRYDNDENEKEFKYIYSDFDSWVSDFSLISRLIKLSSQDEQFFVPLFGKCGEIKNLLNCEAEDEFFTNLNKIDIEFSDISCLGKMPKISFMPEFGKLIKDYKLFLEELQKSGIYSLMTEENQILKKIFLRYDQLLERVKEDYKNFDSNDKKQIKYLLNMFFILNNSVENLMEEENTQTVLIPPYHPVMLEKFYYKEFYIIAGFKEVICKEILYDNLNIKNIERKLEYSERLCEINSGVDIFSFKDWEYEQTEEIYGLYGIYNNHNDKDYKIFKNKVMIDNTEDETDLDKTVLLKINDKAKIISQNIKDYILTFPARADGLEILFINPDEMQHIVSGIHSAVKEIKDLGRNITLIVRILVPPKRAGSGQYIKYWLNNCFEDEEGINIKTYLNYVNFDNNSCKSKIEKINNTVDLAYIYNVFKEQNIDFEKISEIDKKSDIKYPATYCPIPASMSEDIKIRKIDISQRQFETADSYLQLVHEFTRPNEVEGKYRVIEKIQMERKTKELIDFLHEKSRWVVCIDKSIDKDIINTDKQKVIGFSTGKGIFGELNATVSSKNDIIKVLENKLKGKLKNKFIKWSDDIAEKAAENCINISRNLDGSKLLKALNPRDYEINNYLAYVLTMQQLKMNKQEKNYAVKALINLDNYMHWFNDDLTKSYSNKNNRRPDFLILEIENNEELKDRDIPLKIKATVIECKMAKYNENYVEEAAQQLKAGIDKLGYKFSPYNNDVNSRYWFNQLYRAIVFSKLNVQDNDKVYPVLIDKIYNIYNGKFEIEWNGEIFTYWIDINSDEQKVNNLEKPENLEYKLNEFKQYAAGQLFIQKLLIPEEKQSEAVIEYSEIEKENDEEFNKEILGIKDNNEIELSLKNAEIKPELKPAIENSLKEIEPKNISDCKNETDSTENVKITAGNSYNAVSDSSEEILNLQEELNTTQIILEDKDNTETIKDKNKENNEGKFLLGTSLNRKQETFYWEYKHPKLNNRHLLINGNSGFGKTYCIQTLIYEAVKSGISVIVFDYTSGFKKKQLDKDLLEFLGDKYKSVNVKRKKFPINPFKRNEIIDDDDDDEEIILEDAADVANRVAGVFKKSFNFGDQQYSAIYEAIKEGIKKHGDSMNLNYMIEELKNSENSSAKKVISKIMPLADSNPFEDNSEFSWKDIIDAKGMMYVIQLSDFDIEMKSTLNELILWDIWNYAVRCGTEAVPIPIVLDEAQNISHDNSSPSGKILSEGRKFGLSGWYATQFTKGRLKDDEINNLQQAGQKLYFSPPENSTAEIAKYIDNNNERSRIWAEKLSKLAKGECVTIGFKTNKYGVFEKYEPAIIKIASFKERDNG